jgi:hypothetical protein
VCVCIYIRGFEKTKCKRHDHASYSSSRALINLGAGLDLFLRLTPPPCKNDITEYMDNITCTSFIFQNNNNKYVLIVTQEYKNFSKNKFPIEPTP